MTPQQAIEPIMREINQVTLLARVETAILANDGPDWQGKFCECDPEVGAVPCRYCAIYGALLDTKLFLMQLAERTKAR